MVVVPPPQDGAKRVEVFNLRLRQLRQLQGRAAPVPGRPSPRRAGAVPFHRRTTRSGAVRAHAPTRRRRGPWRPRSRSTVRSSRCSTRASRCSGLSWVRSMWHARAWSSSALARPSACGGTRAVSRTPARSSCSGTRTLIRARSLARSPRRPPAPADTWRPPSGRGLETRRPQGPVPLEGGDELLGLSAVILPCGQQVEDLAVRCSFIGHSSPDRMVTEHAHAGLRRGRTGCRATPRPAAPRRCSMPAMLDLEDQAGVRAAQRGQEQER